MISLPKFIDFAIVENAYAMCYVFQVAKLCKPDENSGLGIALEGTVEVEDGREVRPHHYIRDIQVGGPVGLNGILQRGDELLEVSKKMCFENCYWVSESTTKRKKGLMSSYSVT